MSHIAIPIPTFPGKQDIEILVIINNEKQSLHYKVELLYWEECQDPKRHRADCLGEMLAKQDPDWLVYYIGTPTEKFVPVTFLDKESRRLLKQYRG